MKKENIDNKRLRCGELKRPFVASKRLKKLHRNLDTSLSLKTFAQAASDSQDEDVSSAAKSWLENKKRRRG